MCKSAMQLKSTVNTPNSEKSMYEISPTPSPSLSYTESHMMFCNEFNVEIRQDIFSQSHFTKDKALTNQNR